MRPAFALARQASISSNALHARPLARPFFTTVGCSHWSTTVTAASARSYSAKPKPPKEPPVEIAEETLEADFFEEVEIDADPADPEWEGEEVSEGVFMSAMPVSVRERYRELTSDHRATPSRGGRRTEGEEGTPD